MLFLDKSLLTTIRISGINYRLKLSFDNVLRWYKLIEDKRLSGSDSKTIATAFSMFVGDDIDLSLNDKSVALIQIIDHLKESHFSDDEPEVDIANNPIPEPEQRLKQFSYSQDADLIYASFMEQYQIDLIEQQGKLHWDKFNALFQNLNENTAFKKVLKIRQTNINDVDESSRSDVIEAQQFYMLDENKNQDAIQAQMSDMFNQLSLIAK